MVQCHARIGVLADCFAVSQMMQGLWPNASTAEHAAEIAPILAGKAPGTLPVVILVAEGEDGALLGFLEAGLRSHADGCDTRQPVGFIEGWFVREDHRRKGVGSRLVAAAEEWAHRQGCVEMASDTWIDDDVSVLSHEALGYEVVDRSVHFRKRL